MNVSPFIDIHTHQLKPKEKNNIVVLNQTIRDNFSDTVSDAEKYFTYRTFGLHPWYLDKKKYEVGLEKLQALLQENKIIAIGECGLDKLRGPDLDFQISVFEMQLQLAKKYNRPVIIHCVRAFNELIEIKKKEKPSVLLIMHGFNNNKNILKQLINAGFYISLGTAILKEDEKNAHDWRVKINIMPLEKLFFETDDSGENIEVIYNRAAIFLDISLEALKTQIKKNFERVFS